MQFRIYRTNGDSFARVVFDGCPTFIVPLERGVHADGRRIFHGREQMPGWSLSLEYADDDASNDSHPADTADPP